jgi:glyoxylase-like metal-dependent hydrolase (beta-lactamase superfamily II)
MMNMTKKKVVLIVIAVLVVVMIGVIWPIAARMPFPQAERISGKNLVGLEVGGSLVWVIPTESGVVLVDSGGNFNDRVKALKKEIAGRKVHAILLSHGHFDHIAGLPLFPDAMVYVGPGEGPIVRGEATSGSFVADMVYMMMGQPYTPPKLTEFTDGDMIEIDGESFRSIHVYGHTKGSAMYIWNDILFTGDTIVGRGGYVNEIPSPFYMDYDAVRGNVAKVLAYPFDRIADGHVGLHTNAREQVKTYVGM